MELFALRRCLVVATAIWAMTLAVSSSAVAGPGDLDMDFGSFGQVHLGDGKAEALAVERDGRLIVASRDSVGKVRLSRLDENGTPVAGSENGFVEVPSLPPASSNSPTLTKKVIADADGRITVLQSTTNRLLVQRLLQSGEFDMTFGIGGSTEIQFQANDMVQDVSGGFLLIGFTKTVADSKLNEIAILRLDGSGQHDQTFGESGLIRTGMQGVASAAEALPAGMVTIVGDNRGEAFAIRVSQQGVLDLGYGIAGRVKLSSTPIGGTGSHFATTSVAVMANGAQLVGGEHNFIACTIKGNYDCISSFESWVGDSAKGGKARRLPIAAFDEPSIAFGSNANTSYVVGTSQLAGISSFRVDSEGYLDKPFGEKGHTIPMLLAGQSGKPVDASVTADGKQLILVDRGNFRSADRSIALIRLLGDRGGKAAPYRRILSVRRWKQRGKRRTWISGVASPRDAKVQFALRRVNSRRASVCLWYDHKRGKFIRLRRPRSRGCSRHRYMSAGVGTSWEVKLKGVLPRGRYQLFVRASTQDGNFRTPLAVTADAYRSFRITTP